MKRIEKYISGLREDMSDYEIAAGMGNGDIDTPGWVSVSENTDHIKIWDNETPADSQMGFMRLNYNE